MFISLFRKIEKILANDDEPVAGEELLPILTASERPLWAEIREKHFATGENKYSLDTIEQVNL